MWKLRDIILLVVLSIVCGGLYQLWGWLYNVVPIAWVPGQAVWNGLWFMSGILIPVIIRRPGAALLAEVVAAVIEMALGSQWGVADFLAGVLQGLGAEVGFAVFRYRKWGFGAVTLAGILSGVGCLLQWFTEYGGTSYSASVQVMYVIITLVSGAVLGGWLSKWVANAMKRTGVFRNFEIGRQAAAKQ